MLSILYRNRHSLAPDVVLTPDELSQLLTGSSINGAYQSEERDFRIDTSDGFVIHVSADPNHLTPDFQVLVIDYIDDGRIPLFTSTDQTLAGISIERRIHWLRQLYATVYLVEAGREGEIPIGAVSDERYDLEEKLLLPEERLAFGSVGMGSLWVLLRNTTQAGSKSIIVICAMFYAEGRQALIRRLRAKTESDEIDVARKRFDFQIHGAEKWIEFERKANLIKDPDTKRLVKVLLGRSLEHLQIEPPKESL